MKYFIISAVLLIFAGSVFAQTTPKSRDIISSGSSGSSSFSEIKTRTERDSQLNQINNQMNFYRSQNDGASAQKAMELERQKSKIINTK